MIISLDWTFKQQGVRSDLHRYAKQYLSRRNCWSHRNTREKTLLFSPRSPRFDVADRWWLPTSSPGTTAAHSSTWWSCRPSSHTSGRPPETRRSWLQRRMPNVTTTYWSAYQAGSCRNDAFHTVSGGGEEAWPRPEVGAIRKTDDGVDRIPPEVMRWSKICQKPHHNWSRNMRC